MERHDVPTLYQQTVKLVSQNINNQMKYHRDVCVTCEIHRDVAIFCEAIDNIKHDFTDFPKKIKKDVLKCAREEGFLRHSQSVDVAYHWMLENSDMKMKFVLTNGRDLIALSKIGKYVDKLTVKTPSPLTGDGVWASLFYFLPNLKAIHLTRGFNPFKCGFLEAIGQKCPKIKDIRYFEITCHATASEFLKLCFHKSRDNRNIRNKCCTTLRNFEISWSLIDRKEEYKIIDILLRNVVGLKSLGDLALSNYLRFKKLANIPETSLSTVALSDTRGNILHNLKKLCPNLKNLNITFGENFYLEPFHNFSNKLKELIVKVGTDENDMKIYEILKSNDWSNLTSLEITAFNSCSIDLSELAADLPVLEYLHLTDCIIEWNNTKTTFRVLKRFFCLTKINNTIWIGAFSATIEELTIISEEEVDEIVCSGLISLDLPNIQLMQLNHLKLNLDLLKSIVRSFPSLKEVCFELRWTEECEGIYQELGNFVNENKYQCAVIFEFM